MYFFAYNYATDTMEDDIDDIEEDEEMKEEDDDNADDEEAEAAKPTGPKPKGQRKPRSILTGRGVTLGMLLDDGVMEPGEKCLSIDYLVSCNVAYEYYRVVYLPQFEILVYAVFCIHCNT